MARLQPHLQSQLQLLAKMVSKLLVLSALVSLVVASPMARNMQLHESREHPPAGFVRSGARINNNYAPVSFREKAALAEDSESNIPSLNYGNSGI